jgi:exonuclease SbcC
MELQNYRRFRHATIEFPDGVVGIIGHNGAGKSTLIEAISWALYGNEAQRTRKEEVRWGGASKGDVCSVNLEFDLENDIYRVQRQMRGSDLKMKVSLEVNGKLLADGDRAVTQAICDRIGMDYKAFFISVFARQKDLDALSILSPGERRQLVLRMLDIDVLDEVNSRIRSDRKDIQSEVRGLSNVLNDEEGRDRISVIDQDMEGINSLLDEKSKEVGSLEKGMEKMDTEIKQLREKRDSLASKEALYHRTQKEIARKESSLQGILDRSSELDKERCKLEEMRAEMGELREKVDALEALEGQKEKLDGSREEFKEGVALERRLKELRESLPPLKKKVSDCVGTMEEIGDPENSLARVNVSISEIDVSLNGIQGEISEIGAELRGKEGELNRLRSKREEISDMGPESSCPTCERRLGDQHEFLLEKMDGEIEAIKDQISSMRRMSSEKKSVVERERKRRQVLEERSERLRNNLLTLARLNEVLRSSKARIGEIEEEIEELEERRESIGDIEFDEEKYKRIGERIDNLRDPTKRYSELKVRVERLPGIMEELDSLSVSIGELRTDLESSRNTIRGLDFDEVELMSFRKRLDTLSTSREEAFTKISHAREELRSLEARRESLERERVLLERSRELKSERERDMALLSTLEDLMGDFRTNLISRIVPTLSEISSSLFNEMTDSRYGGMEIDKDYGISIFDGNETYGLERFSGGESDLANLCLRLAISKVIADRSGSSVDFLILDEIFGSQDQNRKRNILSSLNRLSRKFSQIILITHIDDVKEFMGNVIYVNELEDGSSNLALEA